MQFKDRLKERMDQKNITTKEFSQLLFNYGSTTNLAGISDNKGSFQSHVRKVQKWLAGNAEPANIEELKKICDILDCDFSYLLGDSPIANLNNQKVAEWLGLDEIAISSIKDYDDVIKKFMSVLIRANEHNNSLGDILLEFLNVMLVHKEYSANKTITITDNITAEIEKLSGDQAIAFEMSSAQIMMEPILYKVALIGAEIGSIRRENKRKEDELKYKEEYEKLMEECMELSGKSREEIMDEIKKSKNK